MTDHDLAALIASRDQQRARVTTLRLGLLRLLGDTSPAARAASDEDLLRALERWMPAQPERAATRPMRPRSIALDFDRTIFAGEFTRADVVDGPPVAGAIEWLREQLAAGVVITIHTCRLTPAYPGTYWNQHADQPAVQAAISDWLGQWLSADELAALCWWTHPGKPGAQMYLDDKGWRFEGVFPRFIDAVDAAPPPAVIAPTRCIECDAWRRRVELDLGDTEEVKGATRMRLRRMLSLTMQQLGTDLAAAQRERDEAAAVSESLAGDLAAATDQLASLEHAIDVFAELLSAGDLDSMRMHLDHVRDVREVTHG